MKKNRSILAIVLALWLLAGCGEMKPSSSAPATADTLAIPSLTVELPRELGAPAAREALAQLPEIMADYGVKIDEFSVTYGTSYAATADALAGGGVQLAFLPADMLLAYGGDAVPILADARHALNLDSTDSAVWNTGSPAQPETGWQSGTFSLICTAPTEYGRNLASRAAGKLTWNELNNARWGVLDIESLAGYSCLELWLEDNYQDNRVADLTAVTTYDSWDALLRAAASGEIDVFPLQADMRNDYREAWQLPASQAVPSGQFGFGRREDICQELRVIGVTPRLYSFVAAVAPGDETLQSAAFVSALEQSLSRIFPDEEAALAAVGAGHYAPVQSADLDGLRRLHMGGI